MHNSRVLNFSGFAILLEGGAAIKTSRRGFLSLKLNIT